MLERLPIDLIVEIGILAGPDDYEELAKTSKRNAIILQKPYIIKATTAIIAKHTLLNRNEYYYDGKLHSFNDHPGIIYHNGSKSWYQHGIRHRDNDQPALTSSVGNRQWFQNGVLHRDNDLPAIIFINGSMSWYKYGRLHRDDNKPAVICSYGYTRCFQNGKAQ
jgi:hypothetical protein